MPAGDRFTPSEHQRITAAVREAERMCGYAVSVHVGPSHGAPRETARRLLSQMTDPDASIVVFVDPGERAMEIITGSTVAAVLDNGRAGLAAATMQSAFAAGAMTNGIVAGVHLLGRAARREATLHTETP